MSRSPTKDGCERVDFTFKDRRTSVGWQQEAQAFGRLQRATVSPPPNSRRSGGYCWQRWWWPTALDDATLSTPPLKAQRHQAQIRRPEIAELLAAVKHRAGLDTAYRVTRPQRTSGIRFDALPLPVYATRCDAHSSGIGKSEGHRDVQNILLCTEESGSGITLSKRKKSLCQIEAFYARWENRNCYTSVYKSDSSCIKLIEF